MKAAVFILMMSCVIVLGRLGENESQLISRYGRPEQISTNDNLRTLNFDFGDYLIQSRLRDGKSVVEFAYLKKKDVQFQESDALAIASKIGGVTNWNLVNSSTSEKTYGSKGTALFAQLNTPPGRPQSIMVTTTFELQRSSKSDPSKYQGNGF